MASERQVAESHTRPRRRWVTATTAATVFGVGVVLGQVLSLSRGLPPYGQQDSPPSAFESLPTTEASSVSGSATTTIPQFPDDSGTIDADTSLSRADDMLRGGRTKEALAIYDDLLATPSADVDPHVLYRRALCWEELGNFEQAWSEYQSLAGKDSDANFLEAVQFAQARVALRMGKTESARWLLGRFSLGSHAHLADDALSDDALSADAAHVLAHLYAQQTLNDVPRELIDDRGLGRSPLPWSVDYALNRISPHAAAKSADETPPRASGIVIADRFGSRPEQLLIDVQLNEINVFDAVGQLAGLVGIDLRWTAASEQFARRHPARADVRGISAARFLDLLLDQLGLYWIEDETAIEIKSAGETPTEERLSMQADQAYRNLRYAVSMHPDSRFAPHTYLDLGNVAFATGDLQDAATFFMELLRQRPPASVRRIAWFNLGKTYRLLNEPVPTENAFLRVVDESLGHTIEPLGYFYLGRHLLDQDNPQLAAKHLVRAVSLAEDSATRSQSSVALAAAYVMGGNEAAANMAIMDHRDAFQAGALTDVAGFVSAFARTRVATSPTNAGRCRQQLASSISRIKPTDLKGMFGYLLVGEAYEVLGLPTQMAIIFEDGIQSGGGPLCDRMRFKVALYYIEQDAREMGRQHLETLLVEGTNGWDRKARLQIAQMALTARDHAACRRHCLQLLASSESEDEKSAILRLLGSSFQSQDDHYSAAVCFAGMLPQGLTTSDDGKALE